MLEPKEKAKELVDKFLEITPLDASLEDTIEIANEKILKDRMLAKQCALICVDEILKSGCTLPSIKTYYGDNEEASKYWLKVKQEIQKL